MVVDCSVMVDALLSKDGDDLRGLLAAHRLTAPHLIDFEVVGAVRGLVLRDRVSARRGAEILSDYELVQLTRWSSAHDLRSRSLELRDNVSAYDAAYVALAEALDCPLATRDLRLARAAEHLIDVIVV